MPADGYETISGSDKLFTPIHPPIYDNCGHLLKTEGPTVSPIPDCEGTVTYTWAFLDCNRKIVYWRYTFNIEAPAAIAGDDRNICLNESTQIGGVAVSGNTYSWSSVPSGFTSTLSNPTTSPLVSTTYTVVETNVASGCSKSNSVTVSVNVQPSITTEPVDQITCIGSSVSFSVAAKGTALSYQWRNGTLALTNGENISGATSATLTILSVSAADVSSCYNVLVTGSCEAMATSKNVSLSLSTLGNASLDSEVTNDVVTIYPNPFTSSIDIKLNESAGVKDYELKIYNNVGEVLFNTTLTKDITTLQTGNLSPGVYLYEVRSKHKIIQVGKLISNK